MLRSTLLPATAPPHRSKPGDRRTAEAMAELIADQAAQHAADDGAGTRALRAITDRLDAGDRSDVAPLGCLLLLHVLPWGGGSECCAAVSFGGTA